MRCQSRSIDANPIMSCNLTAVSRKMAMQQNQEHYPTSHIPRPRTSHRLHSHTQSHGRNIPHAHRQQPAASHVAGLPDRVGAFTLEEQEDRGRRPLPTPYVYTHIHHSKSRRQSLTPFPLHAFSYMHSADGHRGRGALEAGGGRRGQHWRCRRPRRWFAQGPRDEARDGGGAPAGRVQRAQRGRGGAEPARRRARPAREPAGAAQALGADFAAQGGAVRAHPPGGGGAAGCVR